jgi:hypothetical protein
LEEVKEKFEPMIDYKYPTIASRATTIGSAGHAPDEDGNIGYYIEVKNRLHHRWQTPDNKLDVSLPSREICNFKSRKATRRFRVLKQPNKALNKNLILKPRPTREHA